MDGFDETKMKQLQLLKEKMKIAKAQKVEEVKKNEDVFSLSHDVKNVRSFETQDVRFNKIGKKIFDAFTPSKKVTHIKGTSSRYLFQQAKSGNANFPFKAKNGLIKLANESNAFDTPLTFEEVMRRKNEKKKKELERSGQNGMVEDMLNSVRQFNLSDDREDKNEEEQPGQLGQPDQVNYATQVNRANQVNHSNQANQDSRSVSADVYHHTYSGSPPRPLHEKATNEQTISAYATDNNQPINGSISNNSSSFGVDVARNNQPLSHGINSFSNYFSPQVGKGQDAAQKGADLNRTAPHGADLNRTAPPQGVTNGGGPLSESFPGSFGGSGATSLFGSRGDLSSRSGSNIFGGSLGGSLAKLNQSSFNQTVNIPSSGQGPSISQHKGNHSSMMMAPSASSGGKGEVRGESAHSLFQSSGNSTLGASNIFGMHNAPIGSKQQPGGSSALVPPSPNQSIEASSLFARNDGNSNGSNTGSLFNNSFSGNNLNSTRNAPDSAGKSGLFNKTSDGSGGNLFGKARSNAQLFSGSGGIFGKASSGTTNLFGIAPNERTPFGSTANEKTPFGSAANEKNPFGGAANERTPFGSTANEKTPFGSAANENPPEKGNSGKGIFGNVPGSSKPFGNAAGSGNPFGAPPSGSNIFGTPANASSSLFGKSSGGTNLFNKSGGASSTSQFGSANASSSLFAKPSVGSNIFGGSSSLVNNVSSALNGDGAVLADAQSTPASRCGPPGEGPLNTSSKLISDGPTGSGGVGLPMSSGGVGLPMSSGGVGPPISSGVVGLPSISGNRFGLPSSGNVGFLSSGGSAVTKGMPNSSEVNARVMKFKNTLSNIKSKRSGGPNEPMAGSGGENEAQVDPTQVGGFPNMSEQQPPGEGPGEGPGEAPLGGGKNGANEQSEPLQFQNVEQTGECNNDVAAQATNDSHMGEAAKANLDSEKEEGTTIRRTFSSYFNTFIPSIFSSPSKPAAKEECPKGDASAVEKTGSVEKTSSAEVKTNSEEVKTDHLEAKTDHVELNRSAHASPLPNDASEGEKPDANPLCSDKEGEAKSFFRATPLRDPPNGTLSSQPHGGNTLMSSRNSALLNGEKTNEPLQFNPFVDSDHPNSSNHEAPSFRSQNGTGSHAVGEPQHQQMHSKEAAKVLNLPLDVNQNCAANPLSGEDNKTGSLFSHAAGGSVNASIMGSHPGVEGNRHPTVGIPFSDANVGRSADKVGTLPRSAAPALNSTSTRSFLMSSASENVLSERNNSSAAFNGSSRVDEPRGIFQKDPNHNHLIEVANGDSFENKEQLEKMNQIYKNMSCIKKNISYINKYVPSTIEGVGNYLHESINSVQNYDALSSANRTCLEKMNAPSSSAQSNKELKNMINDLNKQMGRGGGPSGGEDYRGGVPLGKVKGSPFCSPFNRANQGEMTHNAKAGVIGCAPDGGGLSKGYPIFNATGKHTPGGNFVNTNLLTPREKLKLINETSKEIATNEESDMDEKIPEHVQKIMERREYFKTKNKLTNSDSKKSIGVKKIKPFVPSECSESFRNTFYTNDNSKNKNNVFSLQNLSSMHILSPNQRSSSGAASANIMGIVQRGLNNSALAPLGGEAPHMMNSADHFRMESSSNNGAAAIRTYPTVDDRSAIFKDSPEEKQNRSGTHTPSSSGANFFIYKNMPPSSSNTMMGGTFASENAQDGYNPLAPTNNFNSAANSGELTNRVNTGGRGGETKPSGESLIKMEEELNRQTDFISNIYTSLGKNNFIYDNRGGMDSTDDKQRGDHGDDGVDPAATNTDDAPLRKRSLDSISRAHHENDDARDDESNPHDNVENGDDDDPTGAQKKKRKFAPNGINEELLPKENRCIDISNCVKEIRDSRTLADISANLSKYTVESERILCDIINDTFKMSLKISSLSDLPFLFEDFP